MVGCQPHHHAPWMALHEHACRRRGRAGFRAACIGVFVVLITNAWSIASTPFGAPFTAPSIVNTNAASDTGHDATPDIATDGQGVWVVVWQSTENLGGAIGSDTDIFVARSLNNGQTWSAPAVLNTNASNDGTADDANPHIFTDGAGHWLCAWESKATIAGAGPDRDILIA